MAGGPFEQSLANAQSSSSSSSGRHERRQRTVSLSGDTDRPMPRNSTGAGRPPGSTAADCTAAPDSTAAWSSAPSLAS
jgi:hypothetical protein